MSVENITVGTIGSKNWEYELSAPFSLQIRKGSVYPAVIHGLVYDRSLMSGTYNPEYMNSLFSQYFALNLGDWTFIKDNYPKYKIRSYKLAFVKYGKPNDIGGNYYLNTYNGSIVGQVQYKDLIVVDSPSLDVGWAQGSYAYGGGYSEPHPGGENNVQFAMEDSDDLFQSYFTSSIPVFYKYDGHPERSQEYLVSDDPDPTHFGGSFMNGETPIPVDPIDPNTPGDSVTGLFSDAGIGLAYGPMRGVVVDNENLNALASKIGLGWLANNIGEAIIGMKMIRTPGNINTTTSVDITIIPSTKGWWDVGETPQVSGKYIKNQFQKFSFGNYTIGEYYNSFLDYTNTSISIYLPFTGIHDLEVRKVIGANIKLDCVIDYISGSLVWYVTVTKDGVSQVLYEWNGNCSMDMAISATDYAQKITQALTGALAVGSSIVGNKSPAGFISGAAMLGESLSNHTTTVGNMNSNFGWTGVMYPYLIFSRSKVNYPSNYNSLKGKPSYKSARLGDLHGFTKVADTRLDTSPNSGGQFLVEELEALDVMLKNGVVL